MINKYKCMNYIFLNKYSFLTVSFVFINIKKCTLLENVDTFIYHAAL